MTITTFQQAKHPEIGAKVTEVSQEVVYDNFQAWYSDCLMNLHPTCTVNYRVFQNYYNEGLAPTQAVKKILFMADNEQYQSQKAFLTFKQEIKAALNGVQSSPQFDILMTMYFQQGLTAHEALIAFFKNNNEELEEEILQLTTPQCPLKTTA